MKKLNSMISYTCSTSLKYVGIYYSIIFTIVILLLVIDGTTDVKVSGLESSTIIYVGVLGVLGFKEEFKMFIQHGFTRKYIFIATISLFVFISGVMALVDTLLSNILYQITQSYFSIYSSIYGYGNIYTNFLMLFMLYMLICSVAYLIILISNKIGKTKSLYASISVVAVFIVIGVLYANFMPQDIISEISETLMKLWGFKTDGTVNYLVPILTLLSLTCGASLGSFIIIRHTELK